MGAEVLNINTPPKKKDEHYSMQSSNLGATAKFGEGFSGLSETQSRRPTMGKPKDQTIDF